MKRSLAASAAVLGGMLLAPVAFAGDDMTSLSYISYLERYATVRPAHGNDTLDVVVNMPVLAGDRLDSARGARVEVQLADGSTLWLDEFTTVDFDAIALSRDDSAPRTALYLADGTAAIEIPATAAGDGSLKLDSPAGAVFLNRPGLYRLELRGNQVRVQVHSGFAELPAGLGSEILRNGEEATIGPQEGGIERAAIAEATDDFWSWVQERRHVATGRTAQYVGARDAERTAVLDSYGDWVYVPTFSSWMWQPHVSVGWVPYSYGRWYWTPVGWSWISYEPWGWYPFHYGSWYCDASFGWVWGFDAVWGPAWVDWFYSPGYVGWCPRGYYDWWYYHNCNPGWGPAGHYPARWSQASLNFSGRVRLGVIDPRPWTMVPSGQFASSHIDRVRMDPKRFFQEGDPNREAIVRSGPLVTQFPGRAPGDGAVEAFFRGGRDTGDVPDLSSLMRREPITGARAATSVPRLHLSSTDEVVRAARVTPDVPGTNGPGSAGLPSWTGRGAPGTGGGAAATDPRPRTLDVRRDGNPPVVRREVVRRDPAAASPRDSGAASGSHGTSAHPANPPAVERPKAPPAERPRSNFSSLSREFTRMPAEGNVYRESDEWSAAASPRASGSPAATRSHAASVPSPRTVTAPRASTRSYSVERPVAQARTAPSVVTRASSGGSAHASSSGAHSGGSSSASHSAGGRRP